MKLYTQFAIAFLVFAVCSCKQTTQSEAPVVTGPKIITSAAKTRLDSTLQAFVASGNIAGVSALIFEKDQEVYFNAFGLADRESNTPMDRNTIVQIYSMTKPITGAALMTLYEKGKFLLDDPLEKYAPEFADMSVFTGVDDKGEIMTTPLKRSITIRDITRHTAGFPRNAEIEGLGPIIAAADAMNRENTLTQMAEKMGKTPLIFQPGSQWEYGPCVDVQAFMVERISGKPYGEYVRERVLDPLGMGKTRYFIPENERDKFAALYLRKGEGVLERDTVTYDNYTQHWPLARGGSGLTATLDDYMRFARMLANGGTLDSVQLLRRETVKLMATDQLSDSITQRSFLPSKGQVGFGIDFAVRVAPPANADENMGVVGEFFWDGAASTLFWVDPVNHLTAVLFVQLMPYDQIGLHKAFRDAVYGPFVE